MPVFKLSVFLQEEFDIEKHDSLIKHLMSFQNLYEWSVLISSPMMIEIANTKKLNTYWTYAWAPKRIGAMLGDYIVVSAYNIKELDYPLEQLRDGYELFATETYGGGDYSC